MTRVRHARGVAGLVVGHRDAEVGAAALARLAVGERAGPPSLQFAHGLGTHQGDEFFTVLVQLVEVIFLGQQLARLARQKA